MNRLFGIVGNAIIEGADNDLAVRSLVAAMRRGDPERRIQTDIGSDKQLAAQHQRFDISRIVDSLIGLVGHRRLRC